jgi:hypothetical protein
MASTYRSVSIIPGKRAGNINQIVGYNSLLNFNNNNNLNVCACPVQINTKVANSFNSYSIQNLSRINREVNAIKYSLGGRVQFGNINNIYPGIDFLGKIKPALPLRNKF